MPTAVFEQYEPLFDGELQLVEAGDLVSWQGADQALQNLRLESRGLETIDEFFLPGEENAAWSRT